jgi:hypothetical protein
MFRFAPLPRLRLQTAPWLYAQLAREFATGDHRRGEGDVAEL